MNKHLVFDVIEEINNLLTNNYIEENGSEGFEAFCEDGNIFNRNDGQDEQRVKVMKRLAPYVDDLSNEIQRILDGE